MTSPFKRKTYATPRLVLRPYRPADHQTWFEALVNPLAKKNKYDREPFLAVQCRKVDFLKLIRRHEKLARQDDTYIYGVFLKKGNTLVGSIDIHVIVRDCYQIGNLGYQVHNRFWRNGYAKEAARKAIDIAFRDLGLHRLEAAINLDNRPSIAVAKGIGLSGGGIIKNYIFENDAWTDHRVFFGTPELFRIKAKAPIFRG